MPFPIELVALILEHTQCQCIGFFVGVDVVSVCGSDHDVFVLVTVVVAVCVLVAALVGDVLTDGHTVETKVAQGEGVSFVRDLFFLQIIDEVLPLVDCGHLG